MATDRDKINEALASAAKDVVLGTWCCGSCSLAAIPDDSPSFAFYHQQDVERAFALHGVGQAVGQGGSAPFGDTEYGQADYEDELSEAVDLVGTLYINFGSGKGEDDEATLAVGRDVNAALRLRGFVTEWDGTSAHKIKVVGVTRMLADWTI